MTSNMLGRCGDRIDYLQSDDGPLALTGTFPAQVPAGGDNRLHGAVRVTNRSDVQVSGTAAAAPDVWVTESGRIVATPVAKDDVGILLELAPGASRGFDATASLLRCAADAGNEDERGSLLPGRYELHATLTVVGATLESAITVLGGPWLVEVV